MRGTQHVGTENYPFHVGRKRHIRLQAIVMLGQIHQPLGLEVTDVDQVLLVAERTSLHHGRPEQVDPLTVTRRV